MTKKTKTEKTNVATKSMQAVQALMTEAFQVIKKAVADKLESVIVKVDIRELTNFAHWHRTDETATTSHLDGIAEWYGTHNANDLITAYVNESGKLEIIQGHLRLRALLQNDITTAPIRVYNAVTPEKLAILALDKTSQGIAKADIFRRMVEIMKGLDKDKCSNWLEPAFITAVQKIGFGQVSNAFAPKNGSLALSEREAKKFKTLRKDCPNDSRIVTRIKAFLASRWVGFKQSLDFIKHASPEIQEYFGYGLKSRQKSFMNELPVEAVKVIEGKDKDGNLKYDYEIDLSSPELQKCAVIGSEAYCDEVGDLFNLKTYTDKVKADKAGTAEAETVEIDVDLEQFCMACIDDRDKADGFMTGLYEALTSCEAGQNLLKSYVKKVGASTK